MNFIKDNCKVLLCFLILGMFLPVVSAASDDFIHAYWLNGTTDVNLTANLTASGSPATVTGLVGSAQNYTGSARHSLTESSAMTAGTIAFWIKPNSAFTGRIFSKTQVSVSDVFVLTHQSDNGIYLGIQDTVIYDDANTSARVGPGTWSHIAVTWNGSSVKYYLNGSLAFSTSSAAIVAANGQPFYLGARWDGGESCDAVIDSFFIYNTAKSASEISFLYNGGSGIEYPFSNAVNESVGRAAIITAFNQSSLVASYTVTSDTQAIVRLLNNTQYSAAFDAIISVGSKRYLFNYDQSSGTTFTTFANLTPSVYVWQNKAMSSVDITASVGLLLNQTLG